jgi:hypothetical protein
MDTEKYEAPRQFARTTSIPESTLAKMRMRGGGPPFVKIGRSVRYPVRAGLEWMALHARASTSALPETPKRPPKKRHRIATVASATAV